MERSHGIALSRRSGVRVLLLFILLAGLVWPAHAQSTATLQGTVTDPAGGAVPNAKVVATNEGTGVQSNTTTDSAGAFLFSSLPIGLYKVEISAPGFQTTVFSGLKLDVATTVTKNVQLNIGQASQTVEVTAEEPLVDTSNNTMGQVINDKTVQQIPLNGRHFTDLSLLTPGTITPPANGFLSAPLRGQGSFGINTAGQREDTTNWLVNGVNLNDNVQNQLTFQPPIDTLAEYKIDNSSFPAQYGRNSGAIVNLATRSGTNQYHGELFEFFRNNDLDARNFFNVAESSTGASLPQAPFKRNDFGVDFGGPILKNKLFFFLAYEGLRQHQSLSVSTTVPSAEQIATVTSPAIKSLLALVPAANLVGSGNAADPNSFNLFSGGVLANVSLNQGSGDIDFELSQKDSMHGYYVVQKDLREEPTAGGAIGANIPGFGDTRSGFRQLLTFSEDHVFSPTLSNTVRLGFNRIHLTFTPNGLLNPTDFDMLMPPGSPAASGLPFINAGGTLGFGGPTGEPQGRGDTTIVLNDGLSWLKGRHTFTFGGEIRRAYNNNIAFNIGSLTYSSLANFLADSANAFTVQLGSGNDKILQPSYDVFAQDSFKWKPNFTINIGLRYAWNATPSEAAGRFTNFDPTTGNLIQVGQPYQQSNLNFQPRVGFAWDPFKNGKTSVRGGYAIMTQAPTTNIVSPLSGNPPFAVPIAASSATNAITAEDPSAAVVGTSLGPAAINPGFDNSYAQDWNLIRAAANHHQPGPGSGLRGRERHTSATHAKHQSALRHRWILWFDEAVSGVAGQQPHHSLAMPGAQSQLPLRHHQSDQQRRKFQLQRPVGHREQARVSWPGISGNLHLLQVARLQLAFHRRDLHHSECLQPARRLRPFRVRRPPSLRAQRLLSTSVHRQPPDRRLASWLGVPGADRQSAESHARDRSWPRSFSHRAARHSRGSWNNRESFGLLQESVLCEPFNGVPSGDAPVIPACGPTVNASLAVPCLFSSTPTKPGGNTYPIVPGSCHPGSLGRDTITGRDLSILISRSPRTRRSPNGSTCNFAPRCSISSTIPILAIPSSPQPASLSA